MKTNYEMTQAQYDRLLEACQSGPLIALQCGLIPSIQQRSNAAWAVLGEEMGFEHMTVEPSGEGDRFFLATPKGEL